MRDAASPIEPKPAGGGWEVRGDTVAEIPQGLGVVGHSVADQTGPDHAGIDDDGAVAIDDHADATDQALIDAAADDNAAAVGHAEHADKIVIEIDPHVAAGFISQRYDLEFRGWQAATTPVEEVTLFHQGSIAQSTAVRTAGPRRSGDVAGCTHGLAPGVHVNAAPATVGGRRAVQHLDRGAHRPGSIP